MYEHFSLFVKFEAGVLHFYLFIFNIILYYLFIFRIYLFTCVIHYTVCACLVSVEYVRSTVKMRRSRLCDYFLVLFLMTYFLYEIMCCK